MDTHSAADCALTFPQTTKIVEAAVTPANHSKCAMKEVVMLNVLEEKQTVMADVWISHLILTIAEDAEISARQENMQPQSVKRDGAPSDVMRAGVTRTVTTTPARQTAFQLQIQKYATE